MLRQLRESVSSTQSSRLVLAMSELQKTQEEAVARELQEKLDAVVKVLELTLQESIAYKEILLSGYLMPTARESRGLGLKNRRRRL